MTDQEFYLEEVCRFFDTVSINQLMDTDSQLHFAYVLDLKLPKAPNLSVSSYWYEL